MIVGGVISNLKSFIFLIIYFSSTIFQLTTLTKALTIEPNHDKPCIVGDAWAEECMSCICLEGRIAVCKPSFCATRLRRELDECKEGEVTHVDCNVCHCKNNARVCTKKDCGKGEGQGKRNRKLRKKDKKGKRATKGNF